MLSLFALAKSLRVAYDMTAIITVEALTKYYGRHRGVEGLTFEVGEGKIFGFLGPNGAGKTTTIRVLMGLLRPTGGHASIGGFDCWKQARAVKRLVGYLPGEFVFDPSLTGGQIIEYLANLRGGVDQTYIRQLVERLELDPGKRFREYSHGNKRKVGLIQAFMHRPRLLILDEYLPAIAVLFALTQAMTWCSDQERGRLEIVLSVPQSRWRIILERFSAVFIVMVIAPFIALLTMLAGAHITGLSLNSGYVAAASFGMLPLELITAAFIYMLAGWLRSGAVVAITSILIALSYFAELLNPLLKLPDWLLSLSIFHQYGTPLVDGPRWGPWLILVGIALMFLGLASLRFSRKDVQ